MIRLSDLSEHDRNEIRLFKAYLQDVRDLHPVTVITKHRDYLKASDELINAVRRNSHKSNDG